jgi:glutaredoxin-related protein
MIKIVSFFVKKNMKKCKNFFKKNKKILKNNKKYKIFCPLYNAEIREILKKFKKYEFFY